MNSPIDDPARKLLELFLQRRWTLGLAESCTGGLLSSWLTQVPGISKVYQGAVVSYAGALKSSLLQVPEAMIAAHGEVSEPVARRMARGARKSLEASWAVAITGIAGPGGGSREKPVGTVCFGVAGPSFEVATTQHFNSQASRDEIQRRAAVFAFDLLLTALR